MKLHLIRYFILLSCVGINLFSDTTFAQCRVAIKVTNNGDIPRSAERLIDKANATTFTDSIRLTRRLNEVLVAMYDNGFLGASFDSIYGTCQLITAVLLPGERFEWAMLKPGKTDEGMLSEAGFRDKFYDNRPVSLRGTIGLNKELLKYCENHGYPFASVSYTDLKFNENEIEATLDLRPGIYYRYDTLTVLGSARLSKKYLASYLSIKPGDTYNENHIRKISNRLKELPMVKEIRPYVISFTAEKARTILYLEDKKASQIDGIIGILPDNEQSGKVQLTGELRLRLLSSFGRGELFDLNWKQPQKQTQDLKVRFNYPFIFSTPIGLDLNLGIYKKDTTYVDVILGAGLQLLLRGGNYFKAFVENHRSDLLSTSQYANATTLPQFADVQITSYGIGLKNENVDYRLNPRRGITAEATASAGNKKIEKNAKINSELYEGIELESVLYKGQADVSYYIPLASRFVIKTGVMGGSIVNDNIFANELFRLGGLRTLRGFDEESILATTYVIGIAETRYILEQNSYLFLFFNSAWYERSYNQTYLNDTPVGFGAGITFETKLGIFSLNYALGREFNNPVLFRAAKVHFGLINYF